MEDASYRFFCRKLWEEKNSYVKKTKRFYDRETILLTNSDPMMDQSVFYQCTGVEPNRIVITRNIEEVLSCIHEHSDASLFLPNHLAERFYPIICSQTNLEILSEHLYVGPNSHGYIDLYEKRDNIFRHLPEIFDVYRLLDDDPSREVYLQCIVRLVTPYQFHYPFCDNFQQYFPDRFVFGEKDVFLDAGMYDGRDTQEFIRRSNGAFEWIYGCEADPANFEMTCRRLSRTERVQVFPYALGETTGACRFLSSKKSSKRSNPHVAPDGDLEIPSVAGDTLPKIPTFIKMDIEGSEQAALRGLRQTIAGSAPKLAICIYHWQSDFWEIPLLIHQLNPSYHLRIWNHSYMRNLLETVCYAWCDNT